MTRAKDAARPTSVLSRVVVMTAVIGTVAVFAGCGSSTTGSTSANSPASTQTAPGTIVLGEWKVDMTTTYAAKLTTFKITNSGATQHELLVFKSDLKASQYPIDADGRILEEGAGITKVSDGDNLDPGKSASRDVDLTKRGTYLF